jgi:predicted nucleotidyltransferase
MDTPHLQVAQAVAHRFSQLPEVEAVAIAGSVATGRANASSDVDVYIYPSTDIPADVRLAIGQEFSPAAQIVDYWGSAVVWFDPASNIEVEALFFNVKWMEDLVLQPLQQHRAQMGFTTSFWHTVKVSQVLFDRNGWFAALQGKANQPYPEALVQAIVDLNYPLLRDIYPSYRAQIATAVARQDLIIINQKVAAFLASYFDILFALNRLPHPGEKRMLDIVERECEKYPSNLRIQITQLLKSSGTASREIVSDIDRLVEGLKTFLQVEGLI